MDTLFDCDERSSIYVTGILNENRHNAITRNLWIEIKHKIMNRLDSQDSIIEIKYMLKLNGQVSILVSRHGKDNIYTIHEIYTIVDNKIV